jgi:hypothetical protein
LIVVVGVGLFSAALAWGRRRAIGTHRWRGTGSFEESALVVRRFDESKQWRRTNPMLLLLETRIRETW